MGQKLAGEQFNSQSESQTEAENAGMPPEIASGIAGGEIPADMSAALGGMAGLAGLELGPLDLDSIQMLSDPSLGLDLATDDAFRMALDRP